MLSRAAHAAQRIHRGPLPSAQRVVIHLDNAGSPSYLWVNVETSEGEGALAICDVALW
jgi:hypothetical protein